MLDLDEQQAGGNAANASIGGIGVTNDGVCAVSYVRVLQAQAVDQQLPAQWTCKHQDVDGWSPLTPLPIGHALPNAQIFVRSMQRFSVAARGNSLMIAVRGPRLAGPLEVAYVRDAMQPQPVVTVKSLRSLTERGGGQLSGLLPLGNPATPAASPLQWLLYGRFLTATATTVAPMSMLSVSTTSDGSPVIQATPVFGSYSLEPHQIVHRYSPDSACVMTMTQNSKLVRVFHLDVDGRRLQQVVVDKSSGRFLNTQSQDVLEKWGAEDGAMRLLRDGDNVFLAVGAHDPDIGYDETSASVWFYPLPRGSQDPKDFVLNAPERLNFLSELRKVNWGKDVSAFVSRISQNTLMLMPVVPANQDDGSGLVTQ